MKTNTATLFLLVLSSLSLFSIHQAAAHGSVQSPKSRVMRVYEGLGQSPRPVWTVQAAAVDNENSYYTWAQLSRNFPAGAGENAQTFTTYIANIPDGQLASAGNMPNPLDAAKLSYHGLDTVSNSWEWPATPVTAGTLPIQWYASAAHNPSFFKVWVSNQSYDYRTPLKWSDLEYLGQPAHTQNGNLYNFSVTLPQRTGHHILYVAWQRIDPVGEVFFSTSDIDFGGDSPATPVLSFTPATLEVNENAGGAVVTANLSAAAPAGGVTASYTTVTGTAGVADFAATAGTLTFAAGQTSQQITIPVTDDSAQETDETFSISLSNVTGATPGQSSATITIKDNDAPSSGAGAAFNIYENWGTGWRAYLRLTNGTAAAWTNWTLEFDAPWNINGGISNGVLVSRVGNHYTVSPASWNTNIPVGTILELEFGTAGSDTTQPSNIKINGQPVTGLVPAVSVAPLSVIEGSATNNATVTVSMEGAHTSAIHVSYATSNGTALAGTDYVASTGNMVFNPGETSKTIIVPILGNTTAQPDRTFTVSLAGVTGQTPPRFTASGQSAIVTIRDDDGGGAGIPLVLTGDCLIEGNSGNKNAVFTFKLKEAVAAGQTVSVNYATSSLTANAGSDYTATSGLLTFAAGSSGATVNVPVMGDTADEALELFQLTLSNAIGCAPQNTTAVAQIVDDEMAANAYGNQRIVAYIDGTSGTPALPPADRVTHIMIAFANIDANGSLFFPIPIDIAGIVALKTQNPSLKILLSIGGWEWSQPFTSVAADVTKRSTFANSCKAMIQHHNLDGIDIDWEWPGGGNTVPNVNDKPNFTALIHATRLALDSHTAVTGKPYELTCYAPASADMIAKWDLPALKNDFNFFNVQGYDLHGTWESVTGHQSGLRPTALKPGDVLNQEQVLAIYTAAGVPKDQLLVGAPFYGQVWTATAFANNGFNQAANPFGQMAYKEIAANPAKNYLRTWDNDAKVPWLFDALGTKRVISYDDPQAIYEKAMYSRNNGHAGVFFWQLGGDSADKQLLITLSDSMAATPSTNPDTDGDGIPDAWEQSNFGNIISSNAFSDNDGDGASDYFEWLSRTSPKSRTSLLAASVMGAGSAQPMVVFNSVSGVTYRLDRSLNLTAWTVLGTTPGTNGEVHYTDNSLPAGSKRAYYRIWPLP